MCMHMRVCTHTHTPENLSVLGHLWPHTHYSCIRSLIRARSVPDSFSSAPVFVPFPSFPLAWAVCSEFTGVLEMRRTLWFAENHAALSHLWSVSDSQEPQMGPGPPTPERLETDRLVFRGQERPVTWQQDELAGAWLRSETPSCLGVQSWKVSEGYETGSQTLWSLKRNVPQWKH